MTVVDVNTGKFTGSGGNLEETVTKNNLEAAEEIVRQLRLRDIGGIIVIDFIDMVLENNRDLVLRRLVECLGRDRTRHQVAEVTSLGLVQMTRKRIGTGLLEAFSQTCEHCQGRGVIIEAEPVDPRKHEDHQQSSNGSRGGSRRSSGRRRGRRGGGDGDGDGGESAESAETTDEAAGTDDSALDAPADSTDSGAADDDAGHERAVEQPQAVEQEAGRPGCPRGQGLRAGRAHGPASRPRSPSRLEARACAGAGHRALERPVAPERARRAPQRRHASWTSTSTCLPARHGATLELRS